MDYIVLSIPAFFILIAIELIFSKLKKKQYYRFNDALTNISCGITQQLTGVFIKTILFVGYLYLYEHFRFFTIKDTFLSWIILFIGVDFFYYWFHRISHQINAMWGAHIVHHQSEEYNLSVALRQSAFQSLFSWIFYLPLAVLGFNPISFVAINAFQTLYQFWIHTKAVGKLPKVLEFIFCTPSHHRVHHGRNPKYIDRNHGGTLIIFDRMFGTFQAEEEEVVYGVTKPLASWNPIWANFDYYIDLAKEMKRPMQWNDRVLMWLKPPGWHPTYLGGTKAPPTINKESEVKYHTYSTSKLDYYILIQYAFVLLVTTFFLFNISKIGVELKIIGAVFILASLMSFGGLFEKKKWAYWLEIIRFLVVPISFYFFKSILPMNNWILIASAVTAIVVSLAWIYQFRSEFS
ncbi:MAG: sterol desaturase family protein [Bacteroidetes bacterium]|nr:sterol desaturase family protein [Bacteroidota bacterium]